MTNRLVQDITVLLRTLLSHNENADVNNLIILKSHQESTLLIEHECVTGKASDRTWNSTVWLQDSLLQYMDPKASRLYRVKDLLWLC